MPNPEKNTVRDSYRVTMQDMQHELTPLERSWSRLLHSPALSLLGPLVCQTLLRPRPLLVGSWLAIVMTIAVYLLERFHGYAGSGAEPLLGFAAGWLLGLCYSTALVVKQRFRIKQ